MLKALNNKQDSTERGQKQTNQKTSTRLHQKKKKICPMNTEHSSSSRSFDYLGVLTIQNL